MKRGRTPTLSEADGSHQRPLPHGQVESDRDTSQVATHEDDSKLRNLNNKYFARFQADCQKALEDDATADLGPLFKEYSSKYSRMREIRMHRNEDPHDHSPETISKCHPSNLPADLPSIAITHPIHPKLKTAMENIVQSKSLSIGDSEEQIMMRGIEVAMETGRQIYSLGGRTVTQIHPDIVFKSGRELDLHTEIHIMDHIHRISKDFPIPQPLGSVVYNGTTYIFMTFIEGTPLQDLWPSLSVDLKTDVRSQLNDILRDLRSLPLISTQLGGGVPPTCKDFRRWVRSSSQPIHNEADFNEFLLSTLKPRIAQTYKQFVQANCLQAHHRIVMTHGDFHPRNIIVQHQNGHVKVVGIIDWEAGGSYPEYWEYVKSLNTMSSIDEDDWYLYLPVQGMGEYQTEWLADTVIETLIM